MKKKTKNPKLSTSIAWATMSNQGSEVRGKKVYNKSSQENGEKKGG